MNVSANLGVEELADFSPSPGLFADLSSFVQALLAMLSAFLG
ncbi:MAG: hypothetical protein ACRDYX_10255 [Egibacteraceae bacterium]